MKWLLTIIELDDSVVQEPYATFAGVMMVLEELDVDAIMSFNVTRI